MSVVNKIQTSINQLEYDFSKYSTEGFVEHLAHRRKRVICVDGIPMSHHTSGGYIQTPDVDYILYNNQRNAFMQTHFILHEIGHMVLDHTQHKIVIDTNDVEVITRQIREHFVFRGHFRVQHPSMIKQLKDEQETEAELFVRLINSQRHASNRLDEIKRNSNVALVPPFVAR